MSRYLSNGTMRDLWMAEWCFRCVHDHAWTHTPQMDDTSESCIVLMSLYAGVEAIPELIDHYAGGPWGARDLECRLFERCPCQDDPGWEPPAPPTPDPNQGLLFEVVDETPFTPAVVIPTNERLTEDVG